MTQQLDLIPYCQPSVYRPLTAALLGAGQLGLLIPRPHSLSLSLSLSHTHTHTHTHTLPKCVSLALSSISHLLCDLGQVLFLSGPASVICTMEVLGSSCGCWSCQPDVLWTHSVCGPQPLSHSSQAPSPLDGSSDSRIPRGPGSPLGQPQPCI